MAYKFVIKETCCFRHHFDKLRIFSAEVGKKSENVAPKRVQIRFKLHIMIRLWVRIGVVNAQLVDGLPSGYVKFLLDLDGKSTTRRHGFEIEGTLTTKD